jgi:predicted  nucleic acid-binding Zn-ribbon protein
MIIKNVTVENWRTLRDPATLEFCDGINVVCGDNGRGKSTVMEALRMAFFDRHGTAAEEVKRIRPWGCGLTPKVRVEFRHGGKDYRLTKQFLGPKSCLVERFDESTGAYARFMEADSADAWLRSVMDAEAPAKGASKPENWGLAALLWIPQGTGEYAGLSAAMKKKINSAADGGNGGNLDNGRSQVGIDGDKLDNGKSQAGTDDKRDNSKSQVQAGGDEPDPCSITSQDPRTRGAQGPAETRAASMESAIMREYGRYFSPTGKPKGSLRELADRIAAARAELDGRQRKLDDMSALRDAVRDARAAAAACESSRAGIAARIAAAEAKCAEYDRIRAERDAVRPRLDALEPRVKLLERDLADLRGARADIERGKKAAAQRERELEEAQSRLSGAEERIAGKMAEAAALDSLVRLEFRAENPTAWEPVDGSPAEKRQIGRGQSALIGGVGRVEVRLPSVGTIIVTGPKSDSAAAVRERLDTLRGERESCGLAIDKCRRELAEYAAAMERLNGKISKITAGGRGEESIAAELNEALGETHALKKSLAALDGQIRALGGDPRAAIDAFRKQSDALRAEEESKRAGASEMLGRLNALGGLGLYEEAGALEAELRKLEARHAAESLRAEAFKLIRDTLETVRGEFRERVATPVEARAGALFARVNGNRRGTVKLADNFSVAGFIPEDSEARVETACLSGGEREQLYFCARIALAEYIIGGDAEAGGAGAGAGEKQTLVLDDFLTATDDSRLSRLKDLLVEFEGRYQYLIFTCHRGRYEGVGGKDVRVIEM